MATKLDSRQVVLRAQSPFIGNAANEQLDVVFPRIDAEMAKLFEDRNVLLVDGGIITFTGTQIQFTEDLRIAINQNIAGVAPYVASLGSTTVTLANNEMLWAIVNRTAATATLAQGLTMPAVIAANQEVFLIAKRVDAGDGTQRLYWRSGMAQDAGQSNRLGASGSGSGGSGLGDDLNALLFQASFRDPFEEGPSDSKSAVDVTAGFTDATTYSAAKKMYTLNYDASKTIAAGTTTTNINISAVAAFTVKIGDIVIANNQARRITAVASQQSYTTEAFTVAPTLAAQVTVSQAVYTKDIYNLPVGGNALSAEFGSATFQEVMFDYEDTSAAGDDIYDVNTAPVVGLAASQNGTAFTDVKIRPTLGTSTIQSFMLPAAGTGLYVRLFAYKQSGSGIVNILGYKAFMQKYTSATTGGVINSAYAFTNGVGTPINATIGVSGGKTTVTLNWQYATGVLPGTTASSIEVWLNGQKLPRFVNATLTPDGSFLETSSNIITLDRDYSQLNLAVEVFQRTQIVDASTSNTTSLANLQEIESQGFQAFINPSAFMQPVSLPGTPVAGTFYSSVVNRAPILNLAADLGARMGINRLTTQASYQLQNEFGPTGQLVHGVQGDTYGQIRFVGNWVSGISSVYGSYVASDATVGNYVEVTFYGTGLNLLLSVAASYGLVASVDGGANGSNIINASTSAVISARGYASNNVYVLASGLTLGVHTVRLTVTASTPAILGFDVINAQATLNVQPGTSYVNGNKMVLGSAQALSHNSSFESGTLGTRGGRVVVYQKADGTIGKALTPTGSALFMSSTDHTNEEIARTYNYREFSSGMTTDFGTQVTAGSRAFVMDDNSTAMSIVGGTIDSSNYFYVSGNTNRIDLQFVGTGIDLFNNNATDPDGTYNFFIDGVQVATNITGASIGNRKTVKIASGLSYGSHHLRIVATNTASIATMAVQSFTVYQPKKPAIPSGATELATYNILGNYAIRTASNISQGTLRKTESREMTYVGTWSASLNTTTSVNGTNISTVSNGAWIDFSFYGTGFELNAFATAGTVTSTVAVDGALYTGAATAFGTGGVWTAGTGTWTAGSQVGSVLSVTGLALGFHTIRVTTTSAANTFNWNGIDVITPVHSFRNSTEFDFQNSVTVGSQGISDSRRLTPVKQGNQTKNVSVAYGVTANPTSTVAATIPIPDMIVTHTNTSGKIRITFSGRFQNAGGAGTAISISVDNVLVGTTKVITSTVDNTLTEVVVVPVSPGFHTITANWLVGGGTTTANGQSRSLTVEEA